MLAEIVLPIDWDRWGVPLLATGGGLGILLGYALGAWWNLRERVRRGPTVRSCPLEVEAWPGFIARCPLHAGHTGQCHRVMTRATLAAEVDVYGRRWTLDDRGDRQASP